MSQLIGLGEYCGQTNFSGLLEIEYVPTEWVDHSTYEYIVNSSFNWQYEIQFVQGSWLKAYALPTSKIWEENQQRNNQGPFYDQSVQAVIPKLKPSVSGEFDKMPQYRYLLRLTDRNNTKWILGTLENPFEFSSNGSVGGDGSLNNYSISFRSQTPKKAAGFDPVLSA